MPHFLHSWWAHTHILHHSLKLKSTPTPEIINATLLPLCTVYVAIYIFWHILWTEFIFWFIENYRLQHGSRMNSITSLKHWGEDLLLRRRHQVTLRILPGVPYKMEVILIINSKSGLKEEWKWERSLETIKCSARHKGDRNCNLVILLHLISLRLSLEF